MPKFSEKSLVEITLLKNSSKKAGRFVPANDLERESFSEPLLLNNLVRAIKKLNADDSEFIRELSDKIRDHIFNNWAVQQTATVEREVRSFCTQVYKKIWIEA